MRKLLTLLLALSILCLGAEAFAQDDDEEGTFSINGYLRMQEDPIRRNSIFLLQQDHDSVWCI